MVLKFLTMLFLLLLSMTPQFLGSNSNTNIAIKIDNLDSYKIPSRVASLVNLNIPMRAALSHSLWEQENPDEHFLQAPVASSLGENLLGPWYQAKTGWSSLTSFSELDTTSCNAVFPLWAQDRGRGMMVFIAKCFCSSTNKPPSEFLIVIGCALWGFGLGMD